MADRPMQYKIKSVEYKVCEGMDASQLEKQVNAKLNDGWVIHHPLVGTARGAYAQPMVLLKKEKV